MEGLERGATQEQRKQKQKGMARMNFAAQRSSGKQLTGGWKALAGGCFKASPGSVIVRIARPTALFRILN